MLVIASVGTIAGAAQPNLPYPQNPPELINDALQFPEGPVFVDKTLYFVDYATSRVLRLNNGVVEMLWHQGGCGANGLVPIPDGLLVACYDAGTLVKISLAGKWLSSIRTDNQGNLFQSPNDLVADHKGGIYFTASGSDNVTPGKVFYIRPDQSVIEVASDMRFSNGVAMSPDTKLLYVVETMAQRILVFNVNADGTLDNRRVFINFPEVMAKASQAQSQSQMIYNPDGIRADRHGNLFIGMYNGGGITIFNPAGELIRQIALPGQHHANLAITPDETHLFATAFSDVAKGSSRGALYKVENPLHR